MTTATNDARPRTRRRAAAIAAATVWLPCCAPVVLGLLRDGSHGTNTYAKLFAMVPGVLLPVLLQLEGTWFGVAGSAATLALLLSAYQAARRLPRKWLHGLQALVMALVALEAAGLAHALRM